MAGVRPDRERRALLGAAVGLPLLREAGGGAGGGQFRETVPLCGAWARALAAYRAAEAEVRGFEAATAGQSADEEERLEGVHAGLGDAMYDALRALLGAPAPDVGALAVKLDLAVAHEVGTLEGGAACLAAMRADAWRLAVAAPRA